MAAKGMSDGDRIAAAYTLGKLARCGGAIHRLHDLVAWVRRSRWDVAEAQALYDKIVVRAGMADLETLIDLGCSRAGPASKLRTWRGARLPHVSRIRRSKPGANSCGSSRS